LKDYLS